MVMPPAAWPRPRIGIYEKAMPRSSSWQACLRAAVQLGYDYVELSIDESDERRGRLTWPPSARRELGRAIEDTGIPVLSMALSGHRRYPLGSRNPAVRQEGLDMLIRAVDLAADVGIQTIQIPAYDVFYEPPASAGKARFIAAARQGAAHAAQAGVMLGLENMDTPFADSVGDALAIVREIGSPWFRLYPDMGNLAAMGHNPAEELHAAVGYLVGVHVKDTRPGEFRRVPFGQGMVDFDAAFRQLAADDYAGPLTIEMWNEGGGARQACRAAREWLTSRLDAVAPPAGTGLSSV